MQTPWKFQGGSILLRENSSIHKNTNTLLPFKWLSTKHSFPHPSCSTTHSLKSVQVLVAQSYPTLCDPMDCSLPGSSVPGILQARILERVAISSSRGSSQFRDQIHVSCISCIGRQLLYHWATWEAPWWYKPQINDYANHYANHTCDYMLLLFSCSVVSDSLWPHGL